MNRRFMLRGWAAVAMAVVAALAIAVAPAAAQKKEKEKPNERGVVGMVLDSADSPIEGAVVQMKNLQSLEIRSFITRADGRYHFNPISTKIDYELKAVYQGKSSNTRLLSTFDSRKQASMNLKIEK
ncbi:MAG: carboxypeptidase-like regulatory domain-containing protein [Bryobacteraceae bacterium]|nr:carboxypeptidase-like regulatory domain-containing protein [Bryobacteraceae bacterium]